MVMKGGDRSLTEMGGMPPFYCSYRVQALGVKGEELGEDSEIGIRVWKNGYALNLLISSSSFFGSKR